MADTKGSMRLFVKIDGLSPFVLRLHKNLKIHHYIEITEQYYGELYGGRPPGNIYINRVIHFANDDKLMEFRRQETISSKFIMQTQETTPIYDEYFACEDSITFGPSPAPFLYPHPIPKIIGLNRLVLLISDPLMDDFFARVWFWGFRGLKVTPDLFMKKLFQRFEVPPLEPETRDPKLYADKITKFMMASGNYNEQNTNTNTRLFQSAWSQNIVNVYTQLDKMFFEKCMKPQIQKKVCNVLYQFVKECFFDFSQDMVVSLEKFCNEKLAQNEILKSYGQQILEAMKTTSRKQHYELFKEIDWEQVVADTIAKFPPPEPDYTLPVPVSAKKYPDLSKGPYFTTDELLTINLNDFAEQLTFMDKYQYNLVQYSELLDQCWSKENKRFKAPNLMRSINFLNKVSGWVSYHVLNEKDEKKRRELLKFFIRLTVRLMDLNSLNMMQAINAGLTTTAVHRLSLTWDGIEEKITSLRKGVDNLISTRGNFKALREKMNDCYENGKPCAPFVGVLLKDLVFFDDGNPWIIDGKINFNKCVGNYVIMHHTLKFQGKEYEFAPDIDIVKKIDSFVPWGEKDLYSASLALQPKGVGK